MRRTFVSVLASLLVLGTGARGDAQQGAQATVTGIVTDAATSRPVAGASVGVVGTQLGTITSADGRFTISSVPAGARSVRVSRIGYGTLERTVNVSAGQVATLNFEI